VHAYVYICACVLCKVAMRHDSRVVDIFLVLVSVCVYICIRICISVHTCAYVSSCVYICE
jgi:hypothetical protein